MCWPWLALPLTGGPTWPLSGGRIPNAPWVVLMRQPDDAGATMVQAAHPARNREGSLRFKAEPRPATWWQSERLERVTVAWDSEPHTMLGPTDTCQ